MTSPPDSLIAALAFLPSNPMATSWAIASASADFAAAAAPESRRAFFAAAGFSADFAVGASF